MQRVQKEELQRKPDAIWASGWKWTACALCSASIKLPVAHPCDSVNQFNRREGVVLLNGLLKKNTRYRDWSGQLKVKDACQYWHSPIRRFCQRFLTDIATPVKSLASISATGSIYRASSSSLDFLDHLGVVKLHRRQRARMICQSAHQPMYVSCRVRKDTTTAPQLSPGREHKQATQRTVGNRAYSWRSKKTLI